MTNDIGQACSKSKQRHYRAQQSLLVDEAQVYALLP